jgi:hypothetical protein
VTESEATIGAPEMVPVFVLKDNPLGIATVVITVGVGAINLAFEKHATQSSNYNKTKSVRL